MIAVHEPLDVLWDFFWKSLDEAECLWAKQMSFDAKADFGKTIESMLLTSILPQPMSRLQVVWSSLPLQCPLSDNCDNVADCWLNVMVDLRGPDQLSDEEATTFMKELWLSQCDSARAESPVSEEAMNTAPELLRSLKYAALCTVVQFNITWSGFRAYGNNEGLA